VLGGLPVIWCSGALPRPLSTNTRASWKIFGFLAHAEGCDFPGFGPHSLRRANITWRQEVGGSSIEASKIAGHANTKITEEYTIVQLKRQDELTRRIQGRRAKAGKKANEKKVLQMKKESAA
jgi:integrase